MARSADLSRIISGVLDIYAAEASSSSDPDPLRWKLKDLLLHCSDGACIGLSNEDTFLCRHILAIMASLQQMRATSSPHPDSWAATVAKLTDLAGEWCAQHVRQSQGRQAQGQGGDPGRGAKGEEQAGLRTKSVAVETIDLDTPPESLQSGEDTEREEEEESWSGSGSGANSESEAEADADSGSESEAEAYATAASDTDAESQTGTKAASGEGTEAEVEEEEEAQGRQAAAEFDPFDFNLEASAAPDDSYGTGPAACRVQKKRKILQGTHGSSQARTAEPQGVQQQPQQQQHQHWDEQELENQQEMVRQELLRLTGIQQSCRGRGGSKGHGRQEKLAAKARSNRAWRQRRLAYQCGLPVDGTKVVMEGGTKVIRCQCGDEWCTWKGRADMAVFTVDLVHKRCAVGFRTRKEYNADKARRRRAETAKQCREAGAKGGCQQGEKGSGQDEDARAHAVKGG